jgi:hypothetical protein
MRLATCLLTFAAAASAFGPWDHNWRIDQQESIHQNFNVTSGSGPRRLLVDTISGYIHITGYSGSEVRVKVDKHILADYNEAVAEAKRDIRLDMSQQGNFVRLYEDGPFRNRDGTNYRGDDYYGFRVLWNCDIEVPADTEVIVKSINHGDIVVKNTSGDYDIHGLNGGIVMEDVAGSGSVSTLNGKVRVTYTHNPQKDTRYHTLNGTVDVYFRNSPDADLYFKKLNGEIYTDFELTLLPNGGGSTSDSNGRFIYRSNREIAGRAGRGGPKLSFETLNGSIRLHSKAQ